MRLRFPTGMILFRHSAARNRAGARRAARACVAGVLFLVLSAAVTAHQRLLHSSPADGARLTSSPRGIRLVFAEAVRLEAFQLAVMGPESTTVALGPPRHPSDSATIVVADVPPLSPGRYAMRWKAVASDGHPTDGTVAFEILPPSADSTAADTLRARRDTMPRERASGATPAAGLNSPLAIFVRWFNYAALAALIGAFWFGSVGRAAGVSGGTPESFVRQLERRLRLAGVVAAIALVAGAMARLLVEVSLLRAWAGAGSVLPLIAPGWRAGIAAQIAGALIAIAAIRRADAGLRWPAVVALGLASLGPALTGHAAAASPLMLAAGMDVVHLVGGGVWLGGLAYLSLVAIPAAMAETPEVRTAILGSVLRAFTPVALSGAAALVVSGIYASWIHLGSFSALVDADYGRVLLLKLALVAAMAVLGALNWRLFGAQADSAGVLSLRRASRLELGFGLMILLATAVLVALPTPASGP